MRGEKMNKEIAQFVQLKMPLGSKELRRIDNHCSMDILFSGVHSATKLTKKKASIKFNLLFRNLCSKKFNSFKSGGLK